MVQKSRPTSLFPFQPRKFTQWLLHCTFSNQLIGIALLLHCKRYTSKFEGLMTDSLILVDEHP